jgi:hypothetical protein
MKNSSLQHNNVYAFNRGEEFKPVYDFLKCSCGCERTLKELLDKEFYDYENNMEVE